MQLLYELSSYYLFVHLFLLTFHVYHLKSAKPKLTPFAAALGTSAYFRWRRAYRQKMYSIALLLFLNLLALVLMATTQRKAFSQGWFMVFQVFILILFLVAVRREFVCLERSPFYAFGLYFLVTLTFLLVFSLLYILTGEHCYSMTCVVSGERAPSHCQFCKIIPIFDSSITVQTEKRTDSYSLDSAGFVFSWVYIVCCVAVCAFAVGCNVCAWRRPPTEVEIFEEYLPTKHLDETLQDD